MNRKKLSLQERVQKAAEVLKKDQDVVKKALDDLGIGEDDEALLDASTTTEEMISSAISHTIYGITVRKLGEENHPVYVLPASKLPGEMVPYARLVAASAILKGKNPFNNDGDDTGGTTDPKSSNKTVSSNDDLVVKHLEHLDSMRPVSQLKDRELLERYVRERDYECERELDLRAKGQPFVVLKDNGRHEAGKEPIDVEESLNLLKRARKGKVNNTIVPYGDKVANVYRITELNMDDRRVELCPLCGEALYKGYCSKCELSFQTIMPEARAYMKLIADESGRFQRDSFADRKALHASAVKGLEDLRATWPSMSKRYDDLAEMNDLPRLVIIENRPSRRIADPFHVAGNRQY